MSKVNNLLLATEGVTSTDVPASEGGDAFHDLFCADSADQAWASSKYRPKKGETWQPETFPGQDEEPVELLHRPSAVENGDFPAPRRKTSDRQRWEAQRRERYCYTPAHLTHLQREGAT